MATTPKGIYYPNDYNEIADIPEDMKKMAESIEEVFEDTDSDLSDIKEEQTTQNNRLNSLEVDNTTNKSDILTNKQEINNIKTEQTTQNTNIQTNADNISALTSRVTETEEDINDIQEEQAEQNTNISTNTTNIESLQEENENLKKIVSQLPQIEGQGTSITLENTIEAQFTKFDVEGNSVQDGTPSPDNEVPIKSAGDNENLLPANNGSETINGVDFTKNSDGTIIANGTATAGINYYINGLDYENIPAGEYTLSDGVGTSGGESSNTFFTFLDGAPNSNSTISLPTFTLSQATNVRGRIVIRSGVTLNNVIFKPKLEKGNKASGYSPYGMGSINEKIQNKNLCKITDFSKTVTNVQIKAENNILSFNGTTNNTISANDAIWKNIKLEVKEKGVYTPSLEKSITGVAFGYYKENSSTLISPYSELEVGSYTLGIYVPANTAFNNFTTGVQIEKGSTATPYVEHEEQDYSIFVQQPMRSIGDVRDCFVKKSDGKLYERHYFNLTDLGDYNWLPVNQNENSRTQGLFMSWSLKNIENYSSSATTIPKLLSNKYISKPNYKYQAYGRNPQNYTISTYGGEFLYIQNSDFSGYTNEQAKEAMAGTILQYPRETPLDLPCTPEQVEQLENKPSTYKDFTIIQSEDETPAYLEVSGIRDIDTMFDKVTNAIVSLGGNV